MAEAVVEIAEASEYFYFITFNRNFVINLTPLHSSYDQGPPEQVTPLCHMEWTVQDDLVAKVDIEQVPYFNAPIYTENKQQIGKIDEIFGNIRDYYVSIKLSENMKASSFEKNTKVNSKTIFSFKKKLMIVFVHLSFFTLFRCDPKQSYDFFFHTIYLN